jgi:hypothetical protein
VHFRKNALYLGGEAGFPIILIKAILLSGDFLPRLTAEDSRLWRGSSCFVLNGSAASGPQFGFEPQIIFFVLQNDQYLKKLRGPSPRVNYTDRETAACRAKLVQTFADRGFRVASATDPHGRILGFLDRRINI